MKQKIPVEDGGLKYLCNEAFYWVKERLPDSISETDKHDRTLAFVLGGSAGGGVAQVGEILIDTINKYGAGLDSKVVASYCLFATITSLGIAKLIAPRYFDDFVEDNPVYAPGVAGVMTGASLKAFETLIFYSR